MSIRMFWFSCSLMLLSRVIHAQAPEGSIQSSQYITVLGIAQDGGYPQAGCTAEHCLRHWRGEEDKRHVVSLGLTDQASGQNWLFEATPDFTTQLQQLQQASGSTNLSGIFLTHAHMGHYAGLLQLGREAMGAKGIPVYVMPRMKKFLENNAPWSQLVALGNIKLILMEQDKPIQLTPTLRVRPLQVPHRDEFSETVGFRIETSEKSLLFIPDIDKWPLWEKDIRAEVARVEVALLDATFYQEGELPNRNMSEIPHPFVAETIALFSPLPAAEKRKVKFIHFNHTNPLMLEGPERDAVKQLGFEVATEGERIQLKK
jgi:pyrroloquinoline quinone biosynthesis protein B|uniref:MBL fold metallo-hydrolase n=2 Tax=Algoriphagus sp. TaxID=1872435 RepID=UPI0040481B1D